jgi:hypothetical protein
VVAGIDGLKIEPSALPSVSGKSRRTAPVVPFRPVHDVNENCEESLDDRVMAGFGGVAEYGITVRWDKNFLKMIRLLIERRAGVRRCSAASASAAPMTAEQALSKRRLRSYCALPWAPDGPRVVPMKNGLVRAAYPPGI